MIQCNHDAKLFLQPKAEEAGKFLEHIARVCYKSEEKETDISHIKLLLNIFKREHMSIFEHLNVSLLIPEKFKYLYINNEFLKEETFKNDVFYKMFGKNNSYVNIYGNIRSFIEDIEKAESDFEKVIKFGILIKIFSKFNLDFLKSLMKQPLGINQNDSIYEYINNSDFVFGDRERYNHKIFPITENNVATMYIMTSRDIAFHFLKHKRITNTMSSNRYINYAKHSSFSDGIPFVLPVQYFNKENEIEEWKEHCLYCEKKYFSAIEKGEKPELARGNLNGHTAVQFYVTKSLKDWNKFLHIRLDKPSEIDPNTLYIAKIIYNQLIAVPEFKKFFEDIKIC